MLSYLSEGVAIKRVRVRHVATFNGACEIHVRHATPLGLPAPPQ
jgi:hypothetical protein